MKSNTLTLVTLVGALFAGASSSALASDIWLGESAQHAPAKTRAQVIAELQEARAQGVQENGELPPAPRYAAAKQERSRTEVRAEAIEAVKVSSHNRGGVYLQ